MMLSPEDDRLVQWTAVTLEEIHRDRQSVDYLHDADAGDFGSDLRGDGGSDGA
jgi:hypothetical protein